ncbi:restriction endonuclease [Streptomyces albidoflavus]|uniref:restriction endonuclease n=1 Tax=Streptomyces albidoflavus TaxID=1886 RepID=UPI00352C6519|nr:restriction endonuclease [Streptomyces albidoflavus]WSD57068.1 restriction endonuclease [Streptomyces albidoflavus]
MSRSRRRRLTKRPYARRFPARRRRRNSGQLGMKILIGALLAAIAIPLARWLLINWWVLLTLALAAAGFGGVWLYRKAEHARWDRTRVNALRFNLPQIDALHHREFAYAVRDLLRRDGCSNARQVGGAGDNGADVIATDPYGRVWVIQCKHRRNGTSGSAIGTPDLQRVNGTARPLHGADIVAVVTNGRFSSRCPELAGALHMHLVDRRVLARWAAGTQPLWDLLPKIPPPRKPVN